MKAEELNSAWQAICEKVKTYPNVDQSQVSAFFSRLQPQAMSDDFLMLTADNDFIKTWIETHYLSHIRRALKDTRGVDYTVALAVDTSQATETQNTEQATYQDKRENALILRDEGPRTEDARPEKQTQPDAQQEQATGKLDSPTSSLTFENFVIGDSNSMAYSMAVAVAEDPGVNPLLNPLFIYGKSGLGKTHLLRAIQNYINENLPSYNVVYVDSAEFLSGYTDAVQAHDTQKTSYKTFKNKYLEADVLLIDDVQYLQGKTQTLDIVFQIFNNLVDSGKQVVLSADRAPKNIDIDERYLTRFNQGGTFDIQPPEVETKLGIIKSLIDEYRVMNDAYDFVIPEEVQRYVAENSSSNIRELKSAVTKIIYRMSLFGRNDISIEEVRALLEDHFSGGTFKKLSIADIQKQVEGYYKVSHADLVGKKRSRNIVYARQIAVYLCRQMLDLPYQYIGQQFGGRDHTTIMYSYTNISEKLKENRELYEEIETIKKLIRDM